MEARRLFTSALFRFSIRQLLLWTALVAVGLVALRSASPTWVAALLGAVLLLLAAAIPLAIFRRETQRAYWIGFALFGWLYLLLVAYGWGLDPNTSAQSPLSPASLATARLSALVHERIYPNSNAASYYFSPANTMPVGSYQLAVTTGAPVVTYDGSRSITVAAVPAPTRFTTSTLVPTVVAAPPTSLPTQYDFVNVSHALWAILLAACGGWFTRWLYATRPAGQSADKTPAKCDADA